mmetsp:Transcript_33712/g.94820  ORF Transcript_33712/g.94820 Transcript_33712/m.94820 type:complete len:236 (-) Transcript_33712:2233-2940(-)
MILCSSGSGRSGSTWTQGGPSPLPAWASTAPPTSLCSTSTRSTRPRAPASPTKRPWPSTRRSSGSMRRSKARSSSRTRPTRPTLLGTRTAGNGRSRWSTSAGTTGTFWTPTTRKRVWRPWRWCAERSLPRRMGPASPWTPPSAASPRPKGREGAREGGPAVAVWWTLKRMWTRMSTWEPRRSLKRLPRTAVWICLPWRALCSALSRARLRRSSPVTSLWRPRRRQRSAGEPSRLT